MFQVNASIFIAFKIDIVLSQKKAVGLQCAETAQKSSHGDSTAYYIMAESICVVDFLTFINSSCIRKRSAT